jgi:hypothetical protein
LVTLDNGTEADVTREPFLFMTYVWESPGPLVLETFKKLARYNASGVCVAIRDPCEPNWDLDDLKEQNRPVESIVFDDQVYSWPPFTPPYSDDGFSDDDSSQQSF